MKTFHRTLIIGCSALALAGCGADEIVSPGTGGNVIINNPAPSPTPTPTPTPTSTLVTPAAGCPTISNPTGLTDAGTITGPTGEWRVCRLPQNFSASTTLARIPGLLYQIDGQVDVGTDGGPAPDGSDGATDSNVRLTIEPGVILFASGSSFLNINRGNEISANGTAARPIIFTSRDNVLGLNNANSSSQWGGVIVNGRAPVTDCEAAGAVPGSVNCERLTEGATTPPRYGGATPNDSSGSMTFVQLRYSGFILSNGDELQALTTGGTGSGTVFENIMSYNSSDDGVEFFGGLVNVKRLIVVGSEDDSIDVDTGVKADLQEVIVVQRGVASDAIIESDSSNTLEENTPRQNTRISNATFIGNSSVGDQLIRIRGRADFTLVNSILFDQGGGDPCLRVDGIDTLDRAANPALDEAGPVVFNSVALDCVNDFRDGSGVTAAGVQARFNVGSNNNAAFTNTLTGLGGANFINGANENGVPVFDPTALSSFFTALTYIGAVPNLAGNWAESWTCNSPTITLGTANTGDCSSLPVY